MWVFAWSSKNRDFVFLNTNPLLPYATTNNGGLTERNVSGLEPQADPHPLAQSFLQAADNQRRSTGNSDFSINSQPPLLVSGANRAPNTSASVDNAAVPVPRLASSQQPIQNSPSSFSSSFHPISSPLLVKSNSYATSSLPSSYSSSNPSQPKPIFQNPVFSNHSSQTSPPASSLITNHVGNMPVMSPIVDCANPGRLQFDFSQSRLLLLPLPPN